MAVLPALAGPTIKILSPIAAAGTTGRVYLALDSCCVAAVPPHGLVIAVTGLVHPGVRNRCLQRVKLSQSGSTPKYQVIFEARSCTLVSACIRSSHAAARIASAWHAR